MIAGEIGRQSGGMFMSNSRISVIVPCFNGSRFLPRVLESIVRQTRPADEILVVDDGSTDGSQNVIREFGHDRVRLIQRETNGGAGAARQTGVDQAAGDLIALIDQDDEWLPPALERMASGCAPIVSRTGGLPEAVGSAGCLVGVGDVPGLVAALKRLLADRTLLEKQGQAARAWAETFPWAATLTRLTDLLRQPGEPGHSRG